VTVRRLAFLGFAAALVALGAIGPPRHDRATALDPLDVRPSVAAAAGQSRAGVVIDNGSSVLRSCIRFSGTLTGVEALERAAAPTLASFGNLGVAVCAIDGHGCPADGSCLTCQQPNAWVYWRAPAGTRAFGFSSVGASNTTVRDGDVEGWRWGSGTPPYATIESICGGSSPTPSVTPSPPPLGSGGSTESPAPTEAPSRTPEAPTPDDAGSSEVAGARASSTTSSTTDSPGGAAETATEVTTRPTGAADDRDSAAPDERDVDDEAAAAVDADQGSGGGAPIGGTVVLGLVLVGLAAGFAVARRRGRVRNSESAS